MDPTDSRSALAAYVRMRLKKEEREYGRGYQAEVARKAGLSTAHVANVINREHLGVGIEAGEALARYWGMTFAQLTEVAKEWAVANPPPSSRTALPPHLSDALDFVKRRGPVPDEVVQKAREIARAGDFSPQAWLIVLSELIVMHEPQKASKTPASAPTRRQKRTGLR